MVMAFLLGLFALTFLCILAFHFCDKWFGTNLMGCNYPEEREDWVPAVLFAEDGEDYRPPMEDE